MKTFKATWAVCVAGTALFVGMLILGSGCTPLSARAQASTGPKDSPSQVVTRFWAAFSKADVASCAKYVEGGKKFDPSLPLWKDALAHKESAPSVDVNILKESQMGGEATVNATIHIHSHDLQQTTEEKIMLVQIDGTWLIVSDLEHGKISADSDWLQNHPTEGMAYYLVHPNEKPSPGKGASETVCLSNLKQLSLGMLMYSNDWDDAYPVAGMDPMEVIQPYVKNRSLLRCPSDKSGKNSYSLNSLLFGKKTTSISEPGTTVGLYEGAKAKLEFRHDGAANVGFVDGHVKKFDKERAKALNWKPDRSK